MSCSCRPPESRCPGFDGGNSSLEAYDSIELRPDLVEQIASAIRQDLKDPQTISNLEIEDAGEATLVRVLEENVIGDCLS